MLTVRSLLGEGSAVLSRRNFQILLLANLLGPLGFALLSPVLDSLVDPLGASPATVGLLISAYSAPSVAMIPIIGVLGDLYGRKPVLLVSLVGYGVAGAAIALTSTFTAALGLRFVQGVFYGGLTPIIITAIGDLYAETEEATAQGLRFTSSGISTTVFPLLAGLLVGIAWQAPFLIYALAIPVAVATYFWFEEPARQSRTDAPRRSRLGYLRELFGLLRQRRLSAMVLARGLGTAVWLAFLTYNSLVVVRLYGGTPGQAGLLFAVASVGLSVASSQAGRVSATFDTWVYPLVGANAVYLTGAILLIFSPILPIAVLGVALIGLAFGLMLSLYRSMITQIVPQSHRAGIVSAAESVGRLFDTMTPVVIGGLLALASATLGVDMALQLTLLGFIAGGTIIGSVALVVVSTAPPLD
ncbi:MAG: MFS transporter [Salinirussus sp.]